MASRGPCPALVSDTCPRSQYVRDCVLPLTACCIIERCRLHELTILLRVVDRPAVLRYEVEYETVQECIDAAVSSSRAILDKYNELSLRMADPDITDDEMNSVMAQLETIGDKIEAEDLWELDRTVERAMDSLRVPPGDAKTAVLSGGEKRRVSLCQLLLGSHDMLLLDEVCFELVLTSACT